METGPRNLRGRAAERTEIRLSHRRHRPRIRECGGIYPLIYIVTAAHWIFLRHHHGIATRTRCCGDRARNRKRLAILQCQYPIEAPTIHGLPNRPFASPEKTLAGSQGQFIPSAEMEYLAHIEIGKAI